MKPIILAIVTATLLGGCLARYTGDHYSRGEARAVQNVDYGTIEELRLVTIEGTKSRVGPVVGAIIGGVAGREIGDGRGSDIGKTVGAVGGGVAGAAVEEGVTRRQGVEITVTLRSGKTIAVVQQIDPEVDLRVGDSVKVLFLGGDARIVPRN